jgi:hypothetical protein
MVLGKSRFTGGIFTLSFIVVPSSSTFSDIFIVGTKTASFVVTS